MIKIFMSAVFGCAIEEKQTANDLSSQYKQCTRELENLIICGARQDARKFLSEICKILGIELSFYLRGRCRVQALKGASVRNRQNLLMFRKICPLLEFSEEFDFGLF